MDRIALAKRLEGLSSVFASETPFNRDLKAMSYVLSKLSDEKFASILANDFNPDVGIMEDIGACDVMAPETPPEDKKVLIIKTPSNEEAAVMSAEATDKTAGMYWNKESSEAVVDYLLRDVVGMNKSVCCDTGRKLEADQVPDGSHKGVPEKPNTLKPEQTPDIAASLDTDMVSKSRGAVRKEAGSKKGPGVPDGTGPMKDSPQCQMKKEDDKESSEKVAEEKEAEEKKVIESEAAEKESAEKESAETVEKESDEKESSEKEAKISDVEKKRADQKRAEADKAEMRSEKAKEKEEKDEETSEEEDKESCMKKESSFSSFEGIELAASMDEATLNDAEAEMLSKLFE